MKKTLLIAAVLSSVALPAFADTYARFNANGVETAYMTVVDSGGSGTYFEIQATNGKLTQDERGSSWKKYPYAVCAGPADLGEIYFQRVVVGEHKKDGKGNYILQDDPVASVVYNFSRMENGKLKITPLFADGKSWPYRVDLAGEYTNVSAMNRPTENLLISFMYSIHPELTKGMFDDHTNIIKANPLTDADKNKYPGIAESLEDSYRLLVKIRSTGKTMEFVGHRNLDWIYRINPDGSAFCIHNKNGVG